MNTNRPVWLITNQMSGSNDEEAIAAIRRSCSECDMRVAHHTRVPEEDLPTPALLAAAEIDLVAVFAGDGTINAALGKLAGWDGDVLILPGGTMNLLFHRLHGELSMEEVLARVGSGRSRKVRLPVIRTPHGDALAGLLAGPGTSWNRVREAMRENSILDMAEGTIEAIEDTLGGAAVVCASPPFGRREGYPLLALNPHKDGIELVAFHAETPGEYLDQTWALMRRDFRDGPHDILGSAARIVIDSTDGKRFGVLIDGEPVECGPGTEFALVDCEVDLLATDRDD